MTSTESLSKLPCVGHGEVLRPCYIPPVSPFCFSTRYPIQPATKSRFIFLFSLLSSSLPILVCFLLPLFTSSRLTTDIIARPNEAIEAPTVNSTIRLSGGSREAVYWAGLAWRRASPTDNRSKFQIAVLLRAKKATLLQLRPSTTIFSLLTRSSVPISNVQPQMSSPLPTPLFYPKVVRAYKVP
ncbi:hypothetical protein GYMLUDRAFT_249708 [Collybiopsis luxurians FD-317 M1]|uniref:Uncharacterized protein n=1 Tax=Collybiopsis luxurians FD-317 M1 TaxID=944289 RepID=A0A0D0BWX5_9AGAR|nr:hypothetical protein GYMLUDRAFT_249708 [Collybiopsis luxurians FD-317 M1]